MNIKIYFAFPGWGGGGALMHIPPNKKRYKVSVVPGKSVSSIDVVNMQAAINTNKTRKKKTVVKKTKVSTLEQQIITDNLLNNSNTDSLMIDA